MIDFKDVVVKYGDFTAMNDLNLSIKEGEFFSFLGPSGSGKTTVLRALTGFVKTFSGQILVADNDITHLPIEQRKIGIVFQSYALFPTMNVYENIAYGLRVKKMKKADIDKEVRAIAKKIDLTDDQLLKKVSELSGGQQQRVAIARALVTKPKILCLDEPLSNLDAKLRHKLRLELKSLQKDFGITTIYVTHDQEEALTLSDRIAVFDNGLLHQVGTPEELYNEPQTEFVANFIGEVNRIDGQAFDQMTHHAIKIDKTADVYILTNDIDIDKKDQSVEISGEIVDAEFFGFYTKYTFKTKNDVRIKFIRFIGSNKKDKLEIGASYQIYVNQANIKQYSQKKVIADVE